ncbi:hypothetical protein KC19_1G139700 [Ceratodon purpureus]|uniref:RCC1-like domain-containing protein n=1 Tax=Ceratodon purpureus TaxID=3225 RepID=A0A8T0J4X6_CERPU|nr:hypothetical protein KC19_1G139700 [Ceratodon purpureus]KAG0590971.1 hypothetical protein KC19_1G139700 [Ceratodon purpureus]
MEIGRCGGREVWSWGAGTHGQLACGTLVDALSPQRVEALCHAAPIVDMACGGAHVVVVFDSGGVATWGRGQAGVLGHGDETTTTVPRLVSSLHGIRITRAAAGWNHSAFLTDKGELYTCGDGAFGQLGHGNTESCLLPCRVEHLSSVCINMVACGMRHTLAMSITEGSPDASIVYAFGFNKRGQLGISTNSTSNGGNNKWRVLFPQKVDSLDMHGVTSVYANGDHSAALTGRGKLFLWGRGYNDSPDSPKPRLADMGLKLCQVSLGWRHGLALTENKEVFAWGNNGCGQLGVSQASPTSGTRTQESAANQHMKEQDEEQADETRQAQEQVLGVDFQKVETQGVGAVWISAGSEHSAAVLENGKVIVWGWAEHGQLGLGSLEDQDVPHIVSLATNKVASICEVNTRVYCGSGYTFVLL